MKKLVLYFTAAAAVFASCAKETDFNEDQSAGKKQVTIIASLNNKDATKTTVDGSGIYSWQASEKIAVLETNAGATSDFTLSNASTGAFSGTLSAGESLVMAVSPKTATSTAMHDGSGYAFDITLPSAYSDYVPGTTNAVMIGVPNGKDGDDYKFTFSHAAALLKITYVNVPVGTKKLVLSSTNNVLTGTWDFYDAVGANLAASTASSTGKTVTLTLKETVAIANKTISFYVPVPTGTYNDLAVELQDAGGTRISGTNKIKSGLTMALAAGDILPLPTISLDPVAAADLYSYTFTAKAYSAAGAQTLNSVSWAMAGTGGAYFGYDETKGQQFGSGNKPYSALTLTSATFAPKGVKRVKINASGANDIVASLSVTVGTMSFLCGGESSISITNTATDYVFECPDDGIVPGAVVVSFSQTSSKAIYVKSLGVNTKLDPALSYATTDYKCANDAVFDTPVLTNPYSVTGITYASSDEDVATVNPTTGAVTIKANGNTTITASFAGDATYDSDSASYSIVVADAYVTLDAATDPVKAEIADNSTVTFDVDSNIDWTAAEGTDDDDIIKSVSKTGNTVTVTFNANDAAEKTATVTITPVETRYRATLTKSMTVTQKAASSSSTTYLTNANIVAAGNANNGYTSWSNLEDENGNIFTAYAIKNQHSNATSSYHYLQIKKYSSNTAYYIQIPELGSKITSITMTVSSTSQPMTGGGNSATLYFSASNSTSATGTGVASSTGASSVTIDCSSLNLNTGYITASAGVRIWDIEVTYDN